jgi:hypothetical protein
VSQQKAFGAFYTAQHVADFLVSWALRDEADVVCDPSFGGGVFLEAAATRLTALGGSAETVYGVELDQNVHARISRELAEQYDIPATNLLWRDFFAVQPGDVPPLDVLIGNPPFIRFQRFAGESRQRALARCAEQGVQVNQLASSWTGFVVHGTALLQAGGRLAMVIPAELLHAPYARPVLAYVAEHFARAGIMTFNAPLFADLSQDTLLLVAEGKGGKTEVLEWQDLASDADLDKPHETKKLAVSPFISGQRRLRHHLIDEKALELYTHLTQHTRSLADVADVGIGYVSGANHFFHVDAQTKEHWQLPAAVLAPAVYRAKAFAGLQFTAADWQAAQGDAGWLLRLENMDALTSTEKAKVEAYLEHGLVQNVHQGYKCRHRNPWYVVPHVRVPDGFLSYMSGLRPQIVTNAAGAVAPNTLHLVRLKPDAGVSMAAVTALWQTSLTALSVELEGHALGGGMLKLEPREAGRVRLAKVAKKLEPLAQELDAMFRANQDDEARALADEVILRQGLGLSEEDCQLLRESAKYLRDRRYYRGRRT